MIASQETTTAIGVNVTQMAKMVSLSVRRFYQLIDAGIFPAPVYLLASRKPMFTTEQQHECLTVRRRQCGINGQIIFFHSPRNSNLIAPKVRTRAKSGSGTGKYDSIRTGLVALGLTAVTDNQIEAAITEAFPLGAGQTPENEVIRKVFLRVRTMKDCGEKVGG